MINAFDTNKRLMNIDIAGRARYPGGMDARVGETHPAPETSG